MSDDAPELPDVRFAVARLGGENERLARGRAAELRAGNRGFGSSLRRWLREERGADNASFATFGFDSANLAAVFEGQGQTALINRVRLRDWTERVMRQLYTVMVKNDFGVRAVVPASEDRITIRIPAPVVIFASPFLPEEVEGDGFVTVYPRPA